MVRTSHRMASFDPEVFMAQSIADALYLRPRLSREVGKPFVGNAPDSFGNGLNGVGGGAARNRVVAESLKRHAPGDLLQDGYLSQAIPDGDDRILRHQETRTASRSMFFFIKG